MSEKKFRKVPTSLFFSKIYFLNNSRGLSEIFVLNFLKRRLRRQKTFPPEIVLELPFFPNFFLKRHLRCCYIELQYQMSSKQLSTSYLPLYRRIFLPLPPALLRIISPSSASAPRDAHHSKYWRYQ